jgi:hypothetical protein
VCLSGNLQVGEGSSLRAFGHASPAGGRRSGRGGVHPPGPRGRGLRRHGVSRRRRRIAGSAAHRLRHRRARRHAALHGRAGGHPQAAPRARPDADPAIDGTRCSRGDRSWPRLRGRRLPHQAVFLRGAPGADPSAYTPGRPGAAAALRGPRAQPGHAGSVAGEAADRAHAHGVLDPRVPPASVGAGGATRPSDRRGVGRSRRHLQQPGGLHPSPAGKVDVEGEAALIHTERGIGYGLRSRE